MQNKTRLIIFDFDGVLADSFSYFYSLIRDGMSQVGLSLTPQQYRNFFIDNVHQGIKDFINNDRKLKIFSEFRKSNYSRHYYDNKRGVKLFPEAAKFLKKIGREHILTVASSGHKSNIENLLEKHKTLGLFDLIIANTATTKEGVLNEILGKFKIQNNEAAMVTDTVGDIEVAKKIGLKTIAATWGFHSAKTLRSANPDYIANSFEMLYKILMAL